MNINYLTENFRQNIYTTMNNSQLPISTIYFVLKDIIGNVTEAYEVAVKNEANEIRNQNNNEE